LTPKILIVTAPSGSGKSTIVHHLLGKFPQLKFSISATTRSSRGKEQHGVDYYFINEETFRSLIGQDAFLEWEMVYPGKYYGTLKAETERMALDGNISVLDIDVQGAMKVKENFKENVLSIFIKAPSKEVLEERLRKRNTDTEEQIQTRLGKAELEESFSKNFDSIIINDNLEDACYEAQQLVANFIK
jgi:guanylate kinase